MRVVSHFTKKKNPNTFFFIKRLENVHIVCSFSDIVQLINARIDIIIFVLWVYYKNLFFFFRNFLVLFNVFLFGNSEAKVRFDNFSFVSSTE